MYIMDLAVIKTPKGYTVKEDYELDNYMPLALDISHKIMRVLSQ